MRSLHKFGKENKKKKRLRALYQNFDGRNLKSTCMKVEKKERNGLLSPLAELMRNEGEKPQKHAFKRLMKIRSKAFVQKKFD